MKILFILLVLLVVACQKEENIIKTINSVPPFEVEYNQLAAAKDYDHIIVIDVRSREEYNAGHVEGAISMPYDEVVYRLDELSPYSEIIIYCRTKNRANEAYKVLEKHFDQVYILHGGYEKCCSN